MCFNFPIMPRLYMALAKGDRTPVIEVTEMTPDIPENCQWATFLRNHDELTLEMVTPEERQFMWDFYSPDFRQRLNLGIRRRLAPLLGNDRAKLELMHSLLFTLPGAPVLYYGDEIGMGDDVSLPDRNGVRTPMQWADEPHAGFSNTQSDALYAPVIRDPLYGFQAVNVAAQMADEGSLLHLVRRMIAKRKELPLLAKGKLEWLIDTPKGTLCFTRTEGDQRLMVMHNLSGETHTIPFADCDAFMDAFDHTAACTEYISLPAYGYRWFISKP
jgi:maltose alpha-D-glucosyltransferase/alpha-amylase